MPGANQPAHLSTFRLRRRTPGSFLLVPCPKQGRSIRCQGQLEAAMAFILSTCPTVVRIQEQPLAIWCAWQGVEDPIEIQLLEDPPTSPHKRQKNGGCSYIVPDFLVEMVDGRRRLVEVKPSTRLTSPIIQRKLAVGRMFAGQKGWTFHIVTEKELFTGHLLTNLKLVNRYRQARLEARTLQQVLNLVPAEGIELLALLSDRQPEYCSRNNTHVFHLLATGQLSFDPSARALDDLTRIFPGGMVSWDPFDSLWAPSGSLMGESGALSGSSPRTVISRKTSNSK